MNTTVQALQRRLIALGFPLPKFGADGDPGAETLAAMGKALDELVSLRGVKDDTRAITITVGNGLAGEGDLSANRTKQPSASGINIPPCRPKQYSNRVGLLSRSLALYRAR